MWRGCIPPKPLVVDGGTSLRTKTCISYPALAKWETRRPAEQAIPPMSGGYRSVTKHILGPCLAVFQSSTVIEKQSIYYIPVIASCRTRESTDRSLNRRKIVSKRSIERIHGLKKLRLASRNLSCNQNGRKVFRQTAPSKAGRANNRAV